MISNRFALVGQLPDYSPRQRSRLPRRRPGRPAQPGEMCALSSD